MAENTKIEWAHHTFNPWRGCTKVSPGCANCYAEKLSHRNPKVLGEWGPGRPRVRAAEPYLRQPFKWDRAAEAAGERSRVFCASLGDWLDDEAPVAWLADLLGTVNNTPNLDWLLLTKRPENFWGRLRATAELWTPRNEAVERWLSGSPPANVWVGTSVEDQERADERIPVLLEIPAAKRFLSMEPLLGPVDLIGKDEQGSCLHEFQGRPAIDWVIVGGESGPGARPMHPKWARSIRDQVAGSPASFFFKQWGAWAPQYATGRTVHSLGHKNGLMWADGQLFDIADVAAYPCEHRMIKVGKKLAGRLLDGRTWDEIPRGEE